MRTVFFKKGAWAILLVLVVIAAWRGLRAGDGKAPLSGLVRSSSGELLGGIPVHIHFQGKNITVVVYTNRNGEYIYRELPSGTHTVSIRVAGFEPFRREGVPVSDKKPSRLDLTLEPSKPSLNEMTSSEILMALAGTPEQKELFSQCANCHSLQFALQRRRDRQGWLQIIEKMRGITPSGVTLPPENVREVLTRTKNDNDRLADLLASVRGPDSGEIPFKLFPRPTEEASTRLLITEYDIPRGAVKTALRGDTRGAWIHDVIRDPKTGSIWYTDHFASVLGRLDPKTGEIKEFPYPHTKAGKQDGSLQLVMDKEGNIWLGVLWQGTVAKFDPRTEKFTEWTLQEDAQTGFVGVDPSGTLWVSSSRTNAIYKLDQRSGQFTKFTIPTRNAGNYGMGLDSKGTIYICEMGAAKVARFDPQTEKFTEWTTPTPNSWPRRLDIDLQDRFWFAEFHAGRIGLFDPQTETTREWKMSDNPYTAPYIVAVDNKNNLLWTTDFNTNLLYRFDRKTERFTQYLLPEPDVEIRHLYLDSSVEPGTLWFPDYSPPGRILKVQVQ